MRYVPISRVTPGMILGHAVLDACGSILLNVNVPLTAKYIEKLSNLGFPALYIRTHPDEDPQEMLEPVRIVTRMRAQSALEHLAWDLSLRGLTTKGLDAARSSVRELLDDVLSNPAAVINVMEIRSFDSYTYGHSVNTCVLSLMAGVTLRFTYGQLMDLGTGTLLHDLGKLFVPPEILNKPSKLTAEEYTQVQMHSQQGYLLLRNQISPLAAHVAFEHHERCDGTGYPRGLKGDEMAQFAKIAAVADSVDAMSTDRVYSKALLPELVATELRNESPAKYDPECVRAVTELIAPYPIGAAVQLASGELGEVVAATRTQIRVLITAGSRKGKTVACPGEATIQSCDLRSDY